MEREILWMHGGVEAIDQKFGGAFDARARRVRALQRFFKHMTAWGFFFDC